MKKVIVLLAVVLFAAIPLFAQVGNLESLSYAKKRPFWAKKYNNLCDRYNSLLSKYKRLNIIYIDTLQYYSEREKGLAQKELELDEIQKNMQPSLEQIISDRKTFEEERKLLDEKKNEYDKTTARFCYIRLSQRYNKTWVDEALKMWSTISSTKVKKEYEGVDVLLQNYNRYYTEVRNVILNAQNAPDRIDKSPNSYFPIREEQNMKNSDYYKNCYGDKNKQIIFLDRQIDLFFYYLKSQEPGKCDFSYMLDKLFPPAE